MSSRQRAPEGASYLAIFRGAGPITLDIDDMGVVTGEFSGNDSGPMEGTVDDTGALELQAMANIAGECSYVGQFDDALLLTGTWACADFGCEGTWTLGPAMERE